MKNFALLNSLLFTRCVKLVSVLILQKFKPKLRARRLQRSKLQSSKFELFKSQDSNFFQDMDVLIYLG
jgi:hypothetical protein